MPDPVRLNVSDADMIDLVADGDAEPGQWLREIAARVRDLYGLDGTDLAGRHVPWFSEGDYARFTEGPIGPLMSPYEGVSDGTV